VNNNGQEMPATPAARDDTRRTDTVRRVLDDAALTKAAAAAYEAGASSNRASMEATGDQLKTSYGHVNDLMQQLLTANATIAKLQGKLAEETHKDRKTKKAEKKLELKKAREKHQAEVLQTLIRTGAPLVPMLGPGIAMLSHRFLPALIDVPREGDKSPRAALARLVAKVYDPDPEGSGPEVLACLMDLAGEEWPLVQVALYEASKDPAAPASAGPSSPPSSNSSSAAAPGGPVVTPPPAAAPEGGASTPAVMDAEWEEVPPEVAAGGAGGEEG
jgi:hypothetical protein